VNKFLADINEFHKKFKQDYDGPPRALPGELMNFRQMFLGEEHLEMMEHNDRGNLPELLDAFVDYAYVLFGTVHLAGMTDIFEKAWDEVHAKNLQKELASEANPSKRGFNQYDIVKPAGWTPPDHTRLIPDPNKVPLPYNVGHIGSMDE
jgi:predicted HAD superfamily Cof-like phosphohydrolase